MGDAVQTRALAGGLCLLGLGVFLWKVVGYDAPLVAGGAASEDMPRLLAPLSIPADDVGETLGVMVMVPAGIALLVFLRQFVGVATIGTFMPVLIGLSFRETGVIVGVIAFTLLVVIGLVVRMYFERLRLLLVPRLAAVIVVVVLAIVALAVFATEFGMEVVASPSLFPLVILAMTIERMAIAWEELSPKDAIQKGLGSLLIAVFSHFLMSNSSLEFLFFSFPELLFVVLAAMLMMGKYTGYRVSELIRFREVVKS